MEKESSVTQNYQVIFSSHELFIKYLTLTLLKKQVWLKVNIEL